MKYLTLLFAVMLSIGCTTTSYKQYSATGQILHDFKTKGDLGVTTDHIGEDASKTNTGLAAITGGSTNDWLTEQQETDAGHQPSITIGGMKLEGTLVHSTGIAETGRWWSRITDRVGKTIVYVRGLQMFESIANTNTAGDVSENASNNAIKATDSNNALKATESSNATKVQLEALKLE